jgi:hypothetical protein
VSQAIAFNIRRNIFSFKKVRERMGINIPEMQTQKKRIPNKPTYNFAVEAFMGNPGIYW